MKTTDSGSVQIATYYTAAYTRSVCKNYYLLYRGICAEGLLPGRPNNDNRVPYLEVFLSVGPNRTRRGQTLYPFVRVSNLTLPF